MGMGARPKLKQNKKDPVKIGVEPTFPTKPTLRNTCAIILLTLPQVSSDDNKVYMKKYLK